MKHRIYNFDIMRVFACVMVICMHSPLPSENANGLFLSSLSYFTAPGLCLFFVISGALLLPVKTDTKTFLTKRLGKVVMPTICFTFLYLILKAVSGEEVNWLKCICSIPFSAQGHGVLWFMYTLIGLYLVSPIISKWLGNASKREEEFYLGIWIVALCYPVLSMSLDVNQKDTNALYYFTGYLGYFIIGHYLNKYPTSITLKRLVIPVAISIVAPVACKFLHIDVDFETVFWYLSIFVAVLCTAIYVVISKIHVGEGKIMNAIVLTSNLSFGIYLIHIAIMRFFLWRLDWILNMNNYYLQSFIIVILTFVLSWVAAYIISLLPFGDYIIGYKKKE